MGMGRGHRHGRGQDRGGSGDVDVEPPSQGPVPQAPVAEAPPVVGPAPPVQTPVLDAAGGTPQTGTATVGAGDTLTSIAARSHTTVAAILAANPGLQANRLAVGQVIRLPAPQTGQAAAAAGGNQGYPAPAVINDAALATVGAAVIAVSLQDDRTYASANIPLLLRQSAQAGVTRPDEVAYILATAEHESHFGKPRFDRSESLVEDHNPYTEGRNGRWSADVHAGAGGTVTARDEAGLDQAYWDRAYGGNLGNQAGTADASNFRGRGFAQLTGRTNYSNLSAVLNSESFSYTLDGRTYGGAGNPAIDLVANPTHVNRVPELAARILVEGSIRGSFTGRATGDYINDRGTDFTQARRVINGTDRAADIAAIALRYATPLRGRNGWATVFTAPAAPTAS
jgi:predicted chitinase